ncbi:MAG: efflux RND transporter periplasmic adaptor subunit [Mesorhizobium sp.]
MRGKIAISVVAAACLVAAGLYLSPTTVARIQQIVSPPAPQAASKPGRAGGQGNGVAVTSATASTADFPIRRYAIGFISSPAVVSISARISSQIVSIAVKDGQMVKAGDLLFTLDDRALKAQVERDNATIAKDQATLVSNQADLARAKDLADKQAGTAQAYDQALATEKAQQATLDADKAQLDADTVQLSFTTIKAPISGRLGAVSVTVGDLVTTSNGNSTATPLVTITQMDPLQVNFSLPETDLALLHKALASPQTASVTLHNDDNPTPIGKGTLDFVDSSVDTASGTIATRASVPNPGLSLWPGQYVNVVLDAGIMPHMVSVPTVAVQPSQKGPFVYVIKPDNTVEPRQVTVALTEGDNSAIASGVTSGERVVTDGQARLKAGTAVRDGLPAATGAKATPKVAENQSDDTGGKRP